MRRMVGWFGVKTRFSVAIAIIALFGLALSACGGSPKLEGTDLGKQPAADFTLTDQRGDTVSLRDLRGKTVALTFIYTHCPDVCPLIAEHLRTAYEALPAKLQDRVALVAVTVDPARDDAAALQAFSEKHGLADNSHWYALTGSVEDLEPVWQAYGVDPGAMIGSMQGMQGGEHDHGAASASATPDSYTLGHTDAIFLIDVDGQERVLMHSSSDPEVLTANLKALAG